MKPTLRFFLFASAAVNALHANQSLQLTSAKAAGVITVPAVAPFNSGSSMQNQTVRMEFRIDSFTMPPDGPHRTVLFDVAGFDVQLWETGEVCGYDRFDSMPSDGNRSCAPTSGHSDVTVRVTRDTAAKTFLTQTFDTQTGVLIGGYCGSSLTGIAQKACGIATLNGVAWNGATKFFEWAAGVSPVQTATLAWFKLYLSAPAQYAIASGETIAADAVDLRFENAMTNQATGSYGVALSYGTPSYTTSPSYSPICSPGPQQIVRAGVDALTLNGSGSYALNGTNTLSYVWQRMSGPGAVQWSAHMVPQAVVRGMIFGTHTFQLTVTDSTGQATSCSVAHGAVATDGNNVVLTDNTQFDHLVSPALMWGKGLWPWYDQMADQTGRAFVARQSVDFVPTWRSASPHGTISFPVTNGYSGTSITGNGTSFRADFFNGSCSNAPDGLHRLIVWYTTQWGTPGYRHMSPVSCTDDTHMIVREATYFAVNPVSAGQYSIMTEPQLATWTNGSNNANYYDNVLAYYQLWRTTGLDYWHNAATALADLWWESPGVDQGQSCWDGGYVGSGLEGWWCPPPRVRATMGLLLRAADGRPSLWANGLYLWLDALMTNSTPSGLIVDTREDSARMGQVCAGAMFMQELGLNPARVATYKSYCAGMVNTHFAPRVQPHGEFLNPQYGLSSSNQGLSTVTVTVGSQVVTSPGNDFPCASITTGTGDGASRMWIVQDNSLAGQSLGDTMTYAVDSCTPSTILLHLPYSGTHAGTGRGYMLNSMGGTFTQPFLMGYMAGQLALASEALTTLGDPADAALARNLVVGLDSWIMNQSYGGYRPSTGGLFYVRNGLIKDGTVGGPNGAGGCEPDPEVANNNGGVCTGGSDGTVQGSRFLGAETIRGMAHGYLYSPDPAQKAAVDDLFGKMWGGLGGPGADANYLSIFFPAQSGKAKDFGFCCGLGGGAQWAAARLGGPAVPASRTVMVPFRLASVRNAARVRITVTQPSGKATATLCSSSPCAISVDTREGTHLMQMDYLNVGGSPIAAGDPLPLRVP